MFCPLRPSDYRWLIVGLAATFFWTTASAQVTDLTPANGAAPAEIMIGRTSSRQSPPPPTAAAPQYAYAPAPPSARSSERVPEGAEVRVRLEDQLSSATSAPGDEFTISTDEDIRLPDGTVIPAGYRGRGEVTEVHKKEMLGKPGDLSIRLDYIRIGDVRVHLRANKSAEGKSTVATTIVLTVLLTPLFLMHHGHEVVFPRGQRITAYVDEDTVVPLPIAAPPVQD